jgi:hypothetical protein
MNISNRSLAILLLIAIMISSISMLNNMRVINITGFATMSGDAQVYIPAVQAIGFVMNTSISFGSGSIDRTIGNTCILTVDGSSSWKSNACKGFSSTAPQPLIIENQGNTNLGIQVATDKSAQDFIGGTNSKFEYIVTNNEANSCASTPKPSSWTDVNTTSPGTTVCNNLGFTDSADSIKISIKVTIPTDASGSKGATFTVIGTET